MVIQVKISLVGLSGAGKTTYLKGISPKAYLMAETQRPITDLEMKAWQMAGGTKVTSSMVPNFAHIVVNKKYKIQGDYFNLHDLKSSDLIVMIIDTLGQEIFYDLNKTAIKGSDGILLLLDSSVSVEDQKNSLINAYNQLVSHFDTDTPVSIILNKQDLWERMAVVMLSVKSKASQLREELNAVIPAFQKCKYYNASALKQWGIKEPLQEMVKKIHENLLKK